MVFQLVEEISRQSEAVGGEEDQWHRDGASTEDVIVRFRTIVDAWSQRRLKPLRVLRSCLSIGPMGGNGSNGLMDAVSGVDDRDGLNELCAVVSYVFEIN